MVGRALKKRIEREGKHEILVREKGSLDLRDQDKVAKFFKKERPEGVIIAAARVGGIHANSNYPVDFLYDNLQIQNNVIASAHHNDVQKLLLLGSSCIYPANAQQPIKESYLLSGQLEPTNEPYAIAKIAGISLCESYYRAVMPTNLYGPHDNFDDDNSHVLPAVIRKLHSGMISEARQVVLWGTGNPRREFLHVDDMADACWFVFSVDEEVYRLSCGDSSFINVGTGLDISIKELAEAIREIIGYSGEVVFDSKYPDGMFRKLLDVSKLSNLGWNFRIDLKDGIRSTYDWFLHNRSVK